MIAATVSKQRTDRYTFLYTDIHARPAYALRQALAALEEVEVYAGEALTGDNAAVYVPARLSVTNLVCAGIRAADFDLEYVSERHYLAATLYGVPYHAEPYLRDDAIRVVYYNQTKPEPIRL